MVFIVLLIVLAMLALALWWFSESRKGTFTETPDDAVRRAQHRDG